MKEIMNIRKKIIIGLIPDTKTKASHVIDRRKVWPKSGWVIRNIEIKESNRKLKKKFKF